MPAGLANTTWVCSATPGSSCPASGTGDINTTIDLAAGGSATFTVTTTATFSAANPIVNMATATVGPGTIDPNPTNNSASASVGVDFTSSLSVQKTASASSVAPGDTFSYDIVVSNAGPARLDGVVISDPVPAGIVAQSWTCVGSAGGVCSLATGTGSPLLSADLPAGGSVTVTLSVQAAADASGPVLNVVTATAGSASSPVTAQASASVDVSPSVSLSGALSITKTTTATSFSTVGTALTYTLVATNTGSVELTNVTITDPNATVGACAPATLAPGQAITCSAVHVVTQADLDGGAVSNTASVSGVSPTGSAVTANSLTVVVPATRSPGVGADEIDVERHLLQGRGDDQLHHHGDQHRQHHPGRRDALRRQRGPRRLRSENSGAGSEPDLRGGSHRDGRRSRCQGDRQSGACQTAQPIGAAGISVDSNTVVLGRAAFLPGTGGDVTSTIVLSTELVGIGGLLVMLAGRRRRRTVH